MLKFSSTGLQDGVDLGLTPFEAPTLDDPDDPSRGSDRVDQFLIPTLCRLGEDEFRHLRTSHTLDLRRLGLMSGCGGRVTSILRHDQHVAGRESHVQLSHENDEDRKESNLFWVFSEDNNK